VFTRSGNLWTQQQKLTASDGLLNDSFGISVSISSDGNTVVVGSYLDDAPGKTNTGSAYVFTRTGVTWTQQQILTASDLVNSAEFGRAVAIAADGSTIIVGAHNNNAAYIFTHPSATWSQQAKIV